jgi:predicted DCC family thiol-disulfide oxidoreductase YuxK
VRSPPISAPVLLYDGTCGFCANSIQFMLRHDRQRTLYFATLDSAFGQALLARNPELRAVDSVLLVEPMNAGRPERVFAYSDAALRATSYLGGPWRLLRLARLVPRPIRDAVYRLIARHRHSLSSTQCLIPPEDERARFLE